MPSPDVLILHDYQLASRDDVMVCLVGFCPPPIGEPLILPLDPMLRLMPALGTLHLAGELLLKPPEAFPFPDRYVELLSFRGRYRRLYPEIKPDVWLLLRFPVSFMLRNVARQHEVYSRGLLHELRIGEFSIHWYLLHAEHPYRALYPSDVDGVPVFPVLVAIRAIADPVCISVLIEVD